MKGKLSVVIPIYNTEKYLDECIQSVITHSKLSIELILIDDGSTDQSGKVCEKWKGIDSRIKTIHTDNKGPFAARKIGLEKTTGEYITFVDADDFIEKESFTYAIPYIEKKIDIICFGKNNIYANGIINPKTDIYPEGIYDTGEIKSRIYPTMIWDNNLLGGGLDPSLCTKIIRRDVLVKAYGMIPDCNLDIGDDVVVVYACMLVARTVAISDRVYYYHRRRKVGEVAPYYKKSDYFDKLYIMYDVLRRLFFDDDKMINQIERLYMSLVQEKGRVWGEERGRIQYLFPFNKICYGSRIALYGAGRIGKDYARQINELSYGQIVSWADKNWNQFKSESVSSPEELLSSQFDYVVIAIKAEQMQKDVSRWLIDNGVTEEKIVLAKG